MMFILQGSWMGLPIEAIPHEGMVRIGGCFCTSLADFLEMVERVFTDTPLMLDDARRSSLQRFLDARVEAREDGDYIVLGEAA